MNWKLALAGTAFAAAAFMVNVAPAGAALDHYACYQVKAKVDKVSGVTFADAVATGTADKCKLKFICVPTDKNGSGIGDATATMTCWQCKGAKPAVSFTSTDQFAGNVAVTTKKLKLICNPSTLTP
jgi:hypothetical protein